MKWRLLTNKEATDKFVSTSLIGYVKIPYKEIVKILGEATFSEASPDEKVRKEWVLDIGGKKATVYDWKNYGLKMTDSFDDWHIGGNNPEVFDEVCDILKIDKKQRKLRESLKC